MYVCPADTIAASPEIVWSLLTDPASYGTWADGRVERVEPPGPARAGQVIHMSSGVFFLRFNVRFEVQRVDHESHDFEFDGFFPFGLTMHEHITVRAIDGGARVKYG